MRAQVTVIGVAALLLTGCIPAAADPPRELPPAGAAFDYQLGGGYELAGVRVIARDSTDEPGGSYAICYVNGFQTQPGEGEHWLDEHPDLVLRDPAGDPLADPGWPDEYLLDTSTDDKRMRIAALLGTVVTSCATGGFDAVEIDNLDSYSRSGGALTLDDNIDLAARYARVAHGLGLAIAQKNGAGHSARLRDEAGFDFAVAEQCMRYQECADYLDAYDGLVFDIEYEGDFAAFCADPRRPASMILRDRGLATPADPAYVYEAC
ncbi:MAG TPA: endo alpha-1,4 polygalactosaminidase [Pseudolysinimonas sp.]|nr:endo alpha-1,4 polygalactosaminidase [Pseudolysinimonas sp.]